MENRGWIKLHRQMLDWEWYDDTNVFRVFMHLLLKANYEPSRYHGFSIPAGGLVIGRETLAKETFLSERQVRTALDKLKSTNEIAIKSNNHFSIVTITCWDKYQTTDQQIDRQKSDQSPTEVQQATTSKESKNITTLESKKPKELEESISCAPTEQPTPDLLAAVEPPATPAPTQPLKGNEANALEKTDTVAEKAPAEPKPAKPEYPPQFEQFWTAYPRHIAKKTALKAWNAAIKRMTPEQIIENTQEFALSIKREGRAERYIPHPATWLNGDRWQDHEPDASDILPAKPIDRSAITDAEWDAAVARFKMSYHTWDKNRYGGEPDMTYNQIPQHILEKHGYLTAGGV